MKAHFPNTWEPLFVGNVQSLKVHDRGQGYDRVKQNREEEDSRRSM